MARARSNTAVPAHPIDGPGKSFFSAPAGWCARQPVDNEAPIRWGSVLVCHPFAERKATNQDTTFDGVEIRPFSAPIYAIEIRRKIWTFIFLFFLSCLQRITYG
jgi:hypothetical protein